MDARPLSKLIKQNQQNVSMQKWIPTTENKKNEQLKNQRSLTIPNIACRNGHQLHKIKKRTDQEAKIIDNTKHCLISQKIKLKESSKTREPLSTFAKHNQERSRNAYVINFCNIFHAKATTSQKEGTAFPK